MASGSPEAPPPPLPAPPPAPPPELVSGRAGEPPHANASTRHEAKGLTTPPACLRAGADELGRSWVGREPKGTHSNGCSTAVEACTPRRLSSSHSWPSGYHFLLAGPPRLPSRYAVTAAPGTFSSARLGKPEVLRSFASKALTLRPAGTRPPRARRDVSFTRLLRNATERRQRASRYADSDRSVLAFLLDRKNRSAINVSVSSSRKQWKRRQRHDRLTALRTHIARPERSRRYLRS